MESKPEVMKELKAQFKTKFAESKVTQTKAQPLNNPQNRGRSSTAATMEKTRRDPLLRPSVPPKPVSTVRHPLASAIRSSSDSAPSTSTKVIPAIPKRLDSAELAGALLSPRFTPKEASAESTWNEAPARINSSRSSSQEDDPKSSNSRKKTISFPWRSPKKDESSKKDSDKKTDEFSSSSSKLRSPSSPEDSEASQSVYRIGIQKFMESSGNDFYCGLVLLSSATKPDLKEFVNKLKAAGFQMGNTETRLTMESENADSQTIVFRIPSIDDFDSGNYLEVVSKQMDVVLVFMWLSSNQKEVKKEVKIFKKALSGSKHKSASVILVGTTSDSINIPSTTLSDIQKKLGCSAYIEVNTSSELDFALILRTVISKVLQVGTLRNSFQSPSTEDTSSSAEPSPGSSDSSYETHKDVTLSHSPSVQNNNNNKVLSLRPKTDEKNSKGDPEAFLKSTLCSLLESGCRGEAISEIDMKVLRGLLFNYPEKLVRSCQEKAHKQAFEKNPSVTKSIFSKPFKVSKFSFTFNVKKKDTNIPVYDTLQITNSFHKEASFSFQNNFVYTPEVFLSFFPKHGVIEKGKTVEIKLGCVASMKCKLQEAFTLDLKVNLSKEGEDRIFSERFYLTVHAEAEEPDLTVTNKFWEVDISSVDTLRSIGSGAAASVFLGTLWGVPVAVKKWEFGRLDKPPIDFERELETIMLLRHSNVVGFIGAVTQHLGKAEIITEFLEYGSLDSVLKNTTIELPFRVRLRMAIDAGKAVLFMHSKGKIHRDLKSLNLLVNSRLTVKLADFGESRQVDNSLLMTRGIGTYLWMAPEVINQQEYSFEADIFSFGLILWELVTRKIPDRSMDEVSRGVIPSIPPDCKDFPEEFPMVIKKCCAVNPKDRPTIEKTVLVLEALYNHLTKEEEQQAQKRISTELQNIEKILEQMESEDS